VTAAYGYPFPAELADLPRDRPAVIEASAGTGKTYLIEHLVVDRLVRGDARIDEMLVVTFSERAAAELVRRIRGLIRRVLRHEPTRDEPAGPHVWTIDPAARERLDAASRSLDAAPISTIHASTPAVPAGSGNGPPQVFPSWMCRQFPSGSATPNCAGYSETGTSAPVKVWIEKHPTIH